MKIKVYIKEIKYRIFFTFLTFFLNAILLYTYKEEIIFLLGQQQTDNFPHFITTNLPELFLCFLKLCTTISLYLSFPTVIIQSWLFLMPALYKSEYKTIKKFVALSLLLYMLCSFVSYFTIIPYCWEFFSHFELDVDNYGVSLQLETRFYDYLNFFINIFFSFNLTFHICLLICFILLKFPLKKLLSLRKFVYLSSFLVATVITPPDISSQLIIAILFITIYEVLFFYLLIHKAYKKVNNGT